MKRWMKWALAGLVVVILAGAIARVLLQRREQAAALADSITQKAQTAVELAASDMVKAQTVDVVQGLAVSGALKAVNSAVVKARVAGELRGLSLREGDFVKAGQIVARIDASEYQSRARQSREQAESAKAQVDVVQRQYDNNKALVDQGFISKSALDTSLANLNAARATFKAAQAATEIATKSVDDTVLRAPISGQVSQRLAQPGERVGVDARVVEIVDLSRMELEAALSTAESTQISVGQTAELQIEGSTQPVTGKVVRINPIAQAASRTVLAYLSIDNAPAGSAAPQLRQGVFVQGTLGTGRQALLAVPVSAVRTDKPAPYVQVVEGGQVAHKTVTLGSRGTAAGESVVAVQGVTDGAAVIRANIGYLREGTKVRFTPIKASAGAAAAVSASVPAAP